MLLLVQVCRRQSPVSRILAFRSAAAVSGQERRQQQVTLELRV